MPEWAKDAPAAVLVIVVVISFLKFLAAERKDRRAITKQCHETHAAHLTSMEGVVERNSDIVKENTRIIGGATEVLRKLNGNP